MSIAERDAARLSDWRFRYNAWQSQRPSNLTPEEWELKRPRSLQDVKDEWQLRRPASHTEEQWEAVREIGFVESYRLLFKLLWPVVGFALGTFASIILTILFTPGAMKVASDLRLEACKYVELPGGCNAIGDQNSNCVQSQ